FFRRQRHAVRGESDAIAADDLAFLDQPGQRALEHVGVPAGEDAIMKLVSRASSSKTTRVTRTPPARIAAPDSTSVFTCASSARGSTPTREINVDTGK